MCVLLCECKMEIESDCGGTSESRRKPMDDDNDDAAKGVECENEVVEREDEVVESENWVVEREDKEEEGEGGGGNETRRQGQSTENHFFTILQ